MDRPILFSGPMVVANMDGRKTQTRRVMKPQPEVMFPGAGSSGPWDFGAPFWGTAKEKTQDQSKWLLDCPYGQPGDRLYVKEASWIWCERRENGTTPTGRPKYLYVPVGKNVVYCADGEKPSERVDSNPSHGWRWKAARFMPRWAARIILDVVSVRLERLQAISEADARVEGAGPPNWSPEQHMTSGELATDFPYRAGFAELWDSINGDRPGCSWAADPWVWVVEFKRVQS